MSFLLERRRDRLARGSGIPKKEKAAARLPRATILYRVENNPRVE
jgi:hypothetical protein